MSYDENPMVTPKNYGVQLVGELALSDTPYAFYILGVVKDGQGYYLSTDSGCSCPSPWESHTMGDFTGPMTAVQAREEIQNLVKDSRENQYNTPDDPAVLLAAIV